MQIKAFVLVAAMCAALPLSASAMTVARPDGVRQASHMIEPAAYDKKIRHKRMKYRAGGRYNKAPSHWHRYDRRPGDWRTRGCIIVGPIWWCP